jgi:hypothetical protein
MPAEMGMASSGYEVAPQIGPFAPRSTMRLAFVTGYASAMSASFRISTPSELAVTRRKHLAASSIGEILSPSIASTTFMRKA